MRALLLVDRKGPIDRIDKRIAVTAACHGKRGSNGIFFHAGERIGWVLAGDGEKQHAAHRVNIRPWSLPGLCGVLLEWCVARRDERCEGAPGAAVSLTGRAEIEKNGGAVRAQVNIFGLDVAVQKSHFVDFASTIEESPQ